MGMISVCNSMVESSACSLASMVDSFALRLGTIYGQNLGYCNVNAQNDASTSTLLQYKEAHHNHTQGGDEVNHLHKEPMNHWEKLTFNWRMQIQVYSAKG